MKKMHGLRICITGNGKGKTTAAMGMVLRAIGHQKKVLVVHCMKNQPSGELAVLAKYPELVTVAQIGAGFCFAGEERAEHLKKAREALAFIEREITHSAKRYDLIVLDEITVLAKVRLISAGDILHILSLKPQHAHMVITGRYAPKKVRDACDTVSVVREERHHFHKGITAQEIIEF